MEKYCQEILQKVKTGFIEFSAPKIFKIKALKHLEEWLSDDFFRQYAKYIVYFAEREEWKLLLDSFYKTISFGTGGRRGLTGIGPNRINVCTVKKMAQGYSQYLLKRFGDFVRQKGVVLAYDGRKSLIQGVSEELSTTVGSYELAKESSKVYAANGIKVYFFSSARSTPELSFAIKYLDAIGGCIFTASHNSSEYNGEKIYDHNGAQLLFPDDYILYTEAAIHVDKVLEIEDKLFLKSKIIKFVGREIDQNYYNVVQSTSFEMERNVTILYSPFHGTGLTSLFPILRGLGFDIHLDKKTSNLSGSFENVPFNIPNPEICCSFDDLIENAELINADIIMATDSDADRLGVTVCHKGNWKFLTGNQIGIILAKYALENSKKRNNSEMSKPLLIKSKVTSSLIAAIARKNNADCLGETFVGFKYLCAEIDRIEQNNPRNFFLLGIEESHGYLVDSYCREKDAAGAAVWIAELAARLKKEGVTLIDYINEIYSVYGYCHNNLSEIKFSNTDKLEKINDIMKYLRHGELRKFGNFQVEKTVDDRDSLSKSYSQNMITFIMKKITGVQFVKVTIRPSGTEPKLKIYTEVFGFPFNLSELGKVKTEIITLSEALEKAVLNECYSVVGIKLPGRSKFLFKQMSIDEKLKYFEIEHEVASLKKIKNVRRRYKLLIDLLSFAGVGSVRKVDNAFSEKYGTSIKNYLKLNILF